LIKEGQSKLQSVGGGGGAVAATAGPAAATAKVEEKKEEKKEEVEYETKIKVKTTENKCKFTVFENPAIMTGDKLQELIK